jgi:hypothetical protein
MNLGTHMPDGKRRKPVGIDVCRTKVKIININRFSPLTIRHVRAKFHLDPTFHSLDIMRK